MAWMVEQIRTRPYVKAGAWEGARSVCLSVCFSFTVSLAPAVFNVLRVRLTEVVHESNRWILLRANQHIRANRILQLRQQERLALL
jgi:hypothetical protein